MSANYTLIPLVLHPLVRALSNSTPHNTSEIHRQNWTEDASAPLLHWRVTHFSGTEGEPSYACIGLTFPHLVFDGMGIASVVHAVEAELLGDKWSIPAALQPERNKNALVNSLEKAIEQRVTTVDKATYAAVGLVGFWWTVCFSAWSYWQYVWHHSRSRMLIVPAEAVRRLVENTRNELAKIEGEDTMARLSKGDVFAAFLFKTIFCNEQTHPERTFRLCSFASLRRFFDGELAEYPHNCIIPLPYERYTAHELQAISLPNLAHHFAQARHSFAVDDVLRCYDTMLEAVATKRHCIFFDPYVSESAVLTNVCIANITNVNWTGTGAGRTLCRYTTSFRKPPLTKLTNLITIAGYLDEGSLVIQSTLTQKRFDRLKGEIQRLMNEKLVDTYY